MTKKPTRPATAKAAPAAGDKVYVLSGFVKKTPKTPVSEIRKALRIKRELGL